jgi:hypothetical protein
MTQLLKLSELARWGPTLATKSLAPYGSLGCPLADKVTQFGHSFCAWTAPLTLRVGGAAIRESEAARA